MRLIDADELKIQLENAYEYTELGEVIDMLNNAPTVEERPQGEWIAVSSMIDNDIHIICSNCKEEFIGESTLEEWTEEYLFCHRCGAKMKGGAV